MLFCSITNLIVLLLLGFFLSPVFIFLFAKLNCAQAIFYRFLLFSSREREKERQKRIIYLVFSRFYSNYYSFSLLKRSYLSHFFFTVCCPFKLRDSLLFSFLNTQRRQTSNINFLLERQLKQLPYIQPTFQTKAKHLDARNDPEVKFYTHTHIHLKNQ